MTEVIMLMTIINSTNSIICSPMFWLALSWHWSTSLLP